MMASFLIASLMSVAAGNCCTVSVDFAKSEGAIRPLHGVNNAPCRVGTNDWEQVWQFRHAGIPFMRTHDTIGMWGGAHYVDIPNVFPDFDADENDPKSYDFTFTDRYLANVVKAGTEIFYRLGVTIENYWQIKRYTTNPPKDFAKWARICEHVVRHYNEGWANGYSWNIRYWEIWNEPDNPSMWSGTMDQFLDLYETSAKHLKACFPELKVGGFGSCGFYGLNHSERSGAAGAEWGFFDDFIKWYDALLARCSKNAVPLDFFSFHLYTDDPWEHKLHTAYAQKKLAEYGLQSTELINDEWNSMTLADTWSTKVKAEAYGKETHEAAAYVAAVLAVMQRETALSKAMFYDAYPGRSYGTIFHTSGKTTQAYESFWAFNKLKELGTSVGVTSSFSNVFAVAAKDATGRQRVLLANYTDQARAVTLKLEPGARYVVSRVDERHARLIPTGEGVRDGDTLVIPWKGTAYLEKLVKEPVKIVFDTDMWGDFDDVGALAILHKYADAGLCEILGTFPNKQDEKALVPIRAINRHYGRPDLPTGATGTVAEYRKILAAQPDKSVTICGVGLFMNFAELLKADPDLVARKVKRLVVMACKHPTGKECNSSGDWKATKYVFENWPTPIEFSDFDFGWNVHTGRSVAEADPLGSNPVRDLFAKGLAARRDCFKWSWDHAGGHPSWDQTAVMLAVFGLDSDGLWYVHRGKFEMVGEDGTDRWTDDPNGPHARIIEGLVSFAQIAEAIDGTMALEPAPVAKPRPVYRSQRPVPTPGKVRVCMDWDDSCFTDVRLAALCRKYGAKATFNITPHEHSDHCYMQRETTERNGTTYHFKRPDGFDREKTVSIPYLTNKDFKYAYEGLKVAAHLNMRYGDTPEDLAYSRKLMEEFLAIAPGVTGQDGFGIVWSGGRHSPGVDKLAHELGFRYCRGANVYEKERKWGEWAISATTYWSEPPEKFWEWYELAKKRGDVFWFWGHTQDLGYDDAIWARLEGIIKRISEDPDAEWIDIDDLVRQDGPDELVARQGLGNFFAKCRAGGTVKVAYFGGSITEAAGWRVQSLAWLRKQFPQTTFVEVNAALGGTGSDYGAYRIEKDVLGQKPDLMFVEFVVNDGTAERLRSIEGYVRAFYTACPGSDICFAYTTSSTFAPALEKGLNAPSAVNFEKIADHYGIPSVNMAVRAAELAREGRLIWRAPRTEVMALAGSECDFKSPETSTDKIIFAADGAHAYRDTGHVLYTEAIARSFTKMMKDDAKPVCRAELPTPLRADYVRAVKFYSVEEAVKGGLKLSGDWRKDMKMHSPDWKDDPPFYRFVPTVWRSADKDAAITFRFKGSSVLFAPIWGPGTGEVEITIDGRTEKKTFFDEYCAFWRLAPTMLCEGLDPGKVHTVEIRNCPGRLDKAKYFVTEAKKAQFAKLREHFEKPDELILGGLYIEGELK